MLGKLWDWCALGSGDLMLALLSVGSACMSLQALPGHGLDRRQAGPAQCPLSVHVTTMPALQWCCPMLTPSGHCSVSELPCSAQDVVRRSLYYYYCRAIRYCKAIPLT